MENREIKKRYCYIDYYKAIAIILVVLGHVNYANEGIKAWIYSFHMSLFFFVSGMLLKSVEQALVSRKAEIIRKKFDGLVVPYVIWGLIYCKLSVKNLIRLLYGSYAMLGSAGTLSSLWFLNTLFLANLIYFIVQLFFGKNMNAIVRLTMIFLSLLVAYMLPKISYGYPWNMNIAFYAFGYLLLGNTTFPLIQKLHNHMINMTKWVAKASCLCLTVLGFCGTLLYRTNQIEEGNINVANALFGNIFTFHIVSFMGIIFVMSMSMFLELLLNNNRILSFIGQNTFSIFIVHKPIISVFEKLFYSLAVSDALKLVLSCVGTLAICCFVTILIREFCPLLAGITTQREPMSSNQI